jgi:lysylphosphatidylglycerol synthetase-like protein (DUF2156 family)
VNDWTTDPADHERQARELEEFAREHHARAAFYGVRADEHRASAQAIRRRAERGAA